MLQKKVNDHLHHGWRITYVQDAMKLKNETREKLQFDRQNAAALQDQYKREKKQVKTYINESKNEHYRNELNESKGNITHYSENITL